MNFQAEPVTINTLLSVSKQYFIPRYQREFSWGKEQIEELWADLTDNIEINEGKATCSEYFIGTLVLAGRDESFDVEIVDGQQRLTVITMFISAICRALAAIGKIDSAKSTFNTYIKGVNRRGEEFKKLDKRSMTNYFSLLIQDLDVHSCNPVTPEDNRVRDAFRVITNLLQRQSISNSLFNGRTITDEQFGIALFSLIDLIADHLKVIRVNVIDQDEAYVIFEILNARGINLGPVDLIKNKVLAEWDNQYPIDFAKQKWDEISVYLNERESPVNIEDYAIHHWTTKFPYTSKRNLYKSFRKKWLQNELSPREYLEDLHSNSEIYSKLASPQLTDWPQIDQRPIYRALTALGQFGISVNRSFLLSLLIVRKEGNISQTQLIDALTKIETFHFAFNAVCSQRPSGIEGTYAKYSRQLRAASNRGNAAEIISELLGTLKERFPDRRLFIDKFVTIRYTNQQTSQKKLIQYILTKIELHKRGSDELRPENLTIEHIASQSNGEITKIGEIGNLLPLGSQLNELADIRKFDQKKKVYARSEFETVKRFLEANKDKQLWTDDDVTVRSQELADLAFDEIWIF